jgi:hypothetical protein
MLHRIAVAKSELGDFDGARIDLKHALTVDAANVELLRELDDLAKKEKKLKEK